MRQVPSTTHQTMPLQAGHDPWLSPDGVVLRVLSGPLAGREVRLPAREGGQLRVGKSRDNDIVLDDKAVSRNHFAIERTKRGLIVRDLESRNGTRVGGVLVREAQIEPGVVIEIGEQRLLVRVDGTGAVVPPSEATSFQLAYGKSLAMRRIFGMLERLAPTEATVLITGETGTGKDVLAKSIHLASASPRSRGPFEVVDCGAVSSSLIESELFGHEKGAFTGATSTHEGAFERAQGGTIFLDELGELPLALQPKLLRVLEARQIRRVGGKRVIDVDVRVIAATTRDLHAELEAETFRRDLFFRLAVLEIRLPPLRERTEDLELLATDILTKAAPGITLSREALAQLRSQEWRGNVRELRNALERAAFLARSSGDSIIHGVDSGSSATTSLDVVGVGVGENDASFVFEDGMSYRDARARVEGAFERRFVTWILSKTGGNVAAAAREAKMDRKYLADLVRKHRLG